MPREQAEGSAGPSRDLSGIGTNGLAQDQRKRGGLAFVLKKSGQDGTQD